MKVSVTEFNRWVTKDSKTVKDKHCGVVPTNKVLIISVIC